MNSKEIVQLYFRKVKEKSDWQTLIAENITFESLSPTTAGKDAYVTAASRFFRMAETLEIKHLVTEGDSACVWVDYFLQLNGRTYICLVSEFLKISDGRIVSS